MKIMKGISVSLLIILFFAVGATWSYYNATTQGKKLPTFPPKPSFQPPEEIVFDQAPPYFKKFGWPIHEEDFISLSSPYGKRDPEEIGGLGDEFHNGLDLFGTWHARITAIADGVVIAHWLPPNDYYKGNGVLGGCIIIEHENGWKSLYGHLSTTYIHEGDKIKQGQVIARQGNTGRSANEHLHFELFLNDQNVNPLVFIKQGEEQYDIP